MVFFRLIFAFDVIVALVVLYFFVIGLADGSVSSFNGSLWAAILAALAAILGGGWALNKSGHRAAAIVVLLILAVPSLLYALFILLLLITQPRWN